MNDRVDRPSLQESAKRGKAFEVAPLRVFEASDLMGAEKEVGLMHDGALYRLKLTRSGKLILTK